MDNTKERILCAAIWYNDSKVYPHQPINTPTGIVVCGLRHCNCYAILAGLLGSFKGKLEVGRNGQGFLTSSNRFVGRAEGFKIAKANSQIYHHCFDNDEEGTLTSEDLY